MRGRLPSTSRCVGCGVRRSRHEQEGAKGFIFLLLKGEPSACTSYDTNGGILKGVKLSRARGKTWCRVAMLCAYVTLAILDTPNSEIADMAYGDCLIVVVEVFIFFLLLFFFSCDLFFLNLFCFRFFQFSRGSGNRSMLRRVSRQLTSIVSHAPVVPTPALWPLRNPVFENSTAQQLTLTFPPE